MSADTVTQREWIACPGSAQRAHCQTRRDIASATDTADVDELGGTGHLLRDQWVDLGIDRQQTIIKSVLDHAVIAPGAPGSRTLDISRVQPHWRV